jgi:hypothetical protein
MKPATLLWLLSLASVFSGFALGWRAHELKGVDFGCFEDEVRTYQGECVALDDLLYGKGN